MVSGTGSGVIYLNKVLNNTNHALDLWRSFVFNYLIDLPKAQGHQGVFLALRFVDRAFDQFNFYLAHF